MKWFCATEFDYTTAGQSVHIRIVGAVFGDFGEISFGEFAIVDVHCSMYDVNHKSLSGQRWICMGECLLLGRVDYAGIGEGRGRGGNFLICHVWIHEEVVETDLAQHFAEYLCSIPIFEVWVRSPFCAHAFSLIINFDKKWKRILLIQGREERHEVSRLK